MIDKTIIRTQRNIDITLDVEGNVSVDKTSSLTDYPTALGTGFNDHIYREPTGVNINGEISTLSCVGDNKFSENRIEKTLELLDDIRLKGETITIFTKALTLPNQLITNLNVSTSESTNNVVSINLQTKELITTKIRTTKINVTPPKTNNGADKVMTDGTSSQGKEEIVTDDKTSTLEVLASIGASAGTGALIGNVIPGIGTGVGAIIGGGLGIIGCIAESIKKNRGKK